jgi:hypothetical protein
VDKSVFSVTDNFHAEKSLEVFSASHSETLLELLHYVLILLFLDWVVREDDIIYIEENKDFVLDHAAGFI